MKAEHLKAWLRAATREKEPDTETCKKVVSVIQAVLREGCIPEALIWTTMFLIPKVKWEVQSYRVGRDHLEGLHVNRQQSAPKFHFIA